MSSLQQEREALVKEQKVNRERVRKCVQETNRRRRDLREKQRLWVIQEQRRREEVLQQRHKKIQDVTEHFQRAYVHPSQRPALPERLTLVRDNPNLEDALSQIRGPKIASTINSTTSGNLPSKLPVTLSESPARHTPVGLQSFMGRRENSPVVKRWQELTKSQEKPPDHSGQDDNVSDSLSSQDSLENEEPTKTAVLHYSEKPLQDLKCPNDVGPLPSAPMPTFVAVKPHLHRLPADLNYNLPTQKETCATMNNLNKLSADISTCKHVNTESPKIPHHLESGESKSSSPAPCKVQFMKGILKTLPGETPLESPQFLNNAVKPVQFLVCDSIELAKARTKSADFKNASKKLRWFDEEAGEGRDIRSQSLADISAPVSQDLRGDYLARVGAGLVSMGVVSQSPIPVARVRGEVQKQGSHVRSSYVGDQARVGHQLAPPLTDDAPHKDTSRLITGDSGVTHARSIPSLGRPTPESSWKGSPAFSNPPTPGDGGRARGCSQLEKVLNRTPTDDEIYQLCRDVSNAFIGIGGQRVDASIVKAGTPRSQSLVSGRSGNKTGADQNRRPSCPINKKKPEVLKIASVKPGNPVGTSPKGFCTNNPNKAVKSAGQRRLPDTYAHSPLDDRLVKPHRSSSQPHQYQRRPPAPTSISIEEQKIFQSLDRLNCQLHRKGGLH
ncbi:uncharacterized protein LOC130911252 [Corythoichthys intestinalis]|uniref:uncharacterized protein LOC130911252 n=1 Tax=Corythoichthys intestinalis TaxID=161448 RepID=UPI0025A4D315|nr:uncharacterized protein LOC130911252 [Corythoichthys intestinalis]